MSLENGMIVFNHDVNCKNCGNDRGVRNENENQYRCTECSSFV